MLAPWVVIVIGAYRRRDGVTRRGLRRWGKMLDTGERSR